MQLFITGIVALLTSTVSPQQLYQIDVEFTGTKKQIGAIRIALYDSEEGFLEGENGFREDRIPITDEEKYTYSFQAVPSGKYAIAAYHDVNDNGELDTNIFGIPKEPYAFSRNPAAKWRAPKFEEVAFDLDAEGQNKQLLLLKKWGKR